MENPPVKILLIEDAPEDARFMQEALARERQTFPCDILHVDSLAAGLKYLVSGGADAILLDLGLSDSEGLDTLTKVRARAPRTPIVVLTASDDNALAEQALQRGAQDYLVKGYVQVYQPLLGRSIRYAIERHRSDRLKDEFVSTVSHELRTPLATVREFTAILSDEISGPLTHDQREYLAIIKLNIERLTRMIDNLLDMAKIEAGHVILNKGVLEIPALIEQTAQSLRPLANNKRIELVLDVPPGLPTLFADGDKITQVLINLISNAIKFTPGSGRVTVRVAEEPNDLVFSIQDTGVGILPEDLPRLFEKFQQVHGALGERGSKGTGLGLAISKRLVELHGGRIAAASTPGKGSAFTFALPKYHPEELFHEFLKMGIERAKRKQSRFSLVVISIANFQDLKARHGTEETTRMLREMEATLRGMVRRRDGGDVVVRWRRGEMVVILAETDKVGAEALGGRLKRILEERSFRLSSLAVRLPIEIATATYPDDAAGEAELLRATERRLAPAHQPKPRVLVVDDEPKVRQLIREALETQEYDVYTAASGPDALQQLRQQPVDLILLDLMMPVMDGYEVYHLVREDPQTKDIPVIIVTAKGERKDRQMGLSSATYNYLTKPFEMDELLEKVRGAMQRNGQT
jgi:diguanylate cyclase (GGDEF)-like protein